MTVFVCMVNQLLPACVGGPEPVDFCWLLLVYKLPDLRLAQSSSPVVRGGAMGAYLPDSCGRRSDVADLTIDIS